ncbi:MAG: hypothetical protein AAFX75_17065 [Pseudomonadota bacterium]
MNTRNVLSASAAMALMALAPPVLAQADSSDKSFDELDTNRDLLISASEAKADPDVASQFAKLDANGDGFVDVQEFGSLDRSDKRYR